MIAVKISAIASVKNEEDAIELFVRHNLNFVDKIHLIDNVSGDNTVEIINRLIQEGLPVSLSISNHKVYVQGQVISREARNHLIDADFIVPLDGDEFIMASSRPVFETDISRVGHGSAGALKWKTFLPGISNDLNFLRSAQVRRRHEYVESYKVVVRRSFFEEGGELSRGNHLAFARGGSPLPMIDLETSLAHFPIRSSVQMVSKAILGTHAFMMCAERTPDQSAHWYEMAEQVRANSYSFSKDQLRELAMNYCNTSPRPDCDTIVDPVPIFAGVEIRHPELICTDLIQRFDRFIGYTVEKFNAAKSIASMIGTL